MAEKMQGTEKTYTIEEVRNMHKLSIQLPVPPDAETQDDLYEYVTLNGKTMQIKCGETVEIPFPFYEILKHGKYANVNILV